MSDKSNIQIIENEDAFAKVKKKTNKKRQQTMFLIIILAIPMLNWLVFWLYVNISSFVLAFQDPRGNWDLINFTLLWDELTSPYGNTIGMALKNTLKYFLSNVFIIFPLSFVISYFIYKRILCYKFFRIIYFLPAIVSGVALTTVYSNMILPQSPLAAFLMKMGVNVPPEGFLMNPKTATSAIIVYCIWTGFSSNTILMSGAMARVPVEILESAKLEGCPPFKELVLLIFPLIWSSLSTMLVFLLTGLFNASGPILLFHPDGAFNTTTLSFWIFKQVYGGGQLGGTGNYGLVSCAGLVFTTIGMPIILFIRWAFEKIPAVEY